MAQCELVWALPDGGLSQFAGISGAPSATASPAPPNSKYALQVDTDEHCYLVNHGGGGRLLPSAGSSPYKFTFLIRLTDTTPSAQFILCGVRNSGGSTDAYFNIALELRTDGDLEVRSNDNSTVDATISAPFTANTWHEISIWYQESATGNAVVTIDGNKTSTTSKDYLASTGTARRWLQLGEGAVTSDVTP